MDSSVESMEDGEDGDSPERRRMRRIDTSREVVFSDFDATGPLRAGIAIDMSAGGLRIRTPSPEKTGVDLQVELKPKPGGRDAEVILMRGRVVYVQESKGGEFEIGVRLHMKANTSEDGGMAHPRTISRDKESPVGTRKLFRDAQSDAQGSTAMDWSTPVPVTFRKLDASNALGSRWHSLTAAAKRSLSAMGAQRRAKRWAVVCAILLLILLLLRGHQRAEPLPRGPSASQTPAVQAALKGEEPEAPEPSGGGFGRGGSPQAPVVEMLETTPVDWRLAAEPAQLLSLAQAAFDTQRPAEAARIFENLRGHPGANATQHFIALLGHAESAAVRGETGLALELTRRAVAQGPEIPSPWRQRARELMANLSGPHASLEDAVPMSEIINLEETPPPQAPPPEIRIEVDTGDYLLNVLKDGAIIGSFPVGLGRDGATPLGDFYIANKITDPDWYNRGEVVPAGDPENPLGKRWMGLGKGERATPYGIHPTNEPGSIRKSLSRGCVRMRPDEAETVFRLCPIGTPVRIHS